MNLSHQSLVDMFNMKQEFFDNVGMITLGVTDIGLYDSIVKDFNTAGIDYYNKMNLLYKLKIHASKLGPNGYAIKVLDDTICLIKKLEELWEDSDSFGKFDIEIYYLFNDIEEKDLKKFGIIESLEKAYFTITKDDTQKRMVFDIIINTIELMVKFNDIKDSTKDTLLQIRIKLQLMKCNIII